MRSPMRRERDAEDGMARRPNAASSKFHEQIRQRPGLEIHADIGVLVISLWGPQLPKLSASLSGISTPSEHPDVKLPARSDRDAMS